MDRRVLIVEADRITAVDLEECLSEAGYLISGVFFDPHEAVQTAEEFPPDIVIIDFQTIKQNGGLAAARQLGDRCGGLVFLATETDEEALKMVQRPRPFTYLKKPFCPSELRNAVRNAIPNCEADR